ncbi:MAG: 3'-5' exonuclease, partial [Planctomycetota bacterium]|nr:3'-5' exonuclease [Planctomycetota bacterium]
LAGPLRTPRNRLLALLYTAYQRRLQDLDVYDDQGQFWHAAALLGEGEFGPFEHLDLLAVDGFQHYDPAQLDVIEALSRQAARTLITLTWEAGRPHLFGLTGRTRRRLRDRFGDRLTEMTCAEPSGLPADLERVRTHLFLTPGPEPDKPTAEGRVAVIRAAGRTREVEEVARRAVDLVRAGATGPGAVAVIARSLEVYAPLVRQVFPAYGLPVRVEAGARLADVPVVVAAMALVRLQAEDYSFRSVSRLLESGYFRPEAFGATADAARAAVRLARDAGVWTGREAYFRGFEHLRGRLARDAQATDESGEAVLPPERRAERAGEIDRAEALLSRVFDATALPASAPRRDLADRLREIVQTAGLWQAARSHEQPAHRARDLKALAGLNDVLAEVALLDPPDGHGATAAEFLDEVTRGLAAETITAPEPADAPVVVLDVRQCRALSFEHVFLVGLAEKAFPHRGRRHPFFSDTERADLRQRGVDLADTGHAAEEEKLLFYLAATRAGRSLTLSYPSLDSSGRPQLPSHYVEEVKGLFADTGKASTVPEAEVGVRDLDLPAEAARSRRELLAATMFALWGPGANPEMDRDLAVLHTLTADGPAVETALTGLAAEWEREHGQGFGP